MKMKKITFSIILLMVTFILLAACSQKETGGSSKNVTEKAQQTFLMFSETHVSEDGESIGELYIKTIDSEEEKIASV